MLTPDQQKRYARQTRLPQIGEAGQAKILRSNALIIGLGGLGSPVAMYLAAAGVGQMTLSDFDRVDESNLQRQIIHRYEDIGEPKARSAERTLRTISPEIKLDVKDYELDLDELHDLAGQADIILDCTDNFPSRFGLNRISLATQTPLVSGAAIRWEGQVTSFDPRTPDCPCYQCLYQDEGAESASCAMEGVVSPLVGIIGTMQALEAVNTLLGQAQLNGKMWLFDGAGMEWQQMILPKNPNCPACGSG